MEWQIVLAIALAIPVVLVPIAFVWYLNVSGLYAVIRTARQRQARRAEALRKAKATVEVRGK